MKQKLPLRKRKVSARTKHLYESRRRHSTALGENERKEMSNTISKSGREDYREYVNGVLNDIEAAESVGNMREISRLTRQLTNKRTAICINPSKTRDGSSQIVTESQEWEQFIGAKFSRPESDSNRDLGCLVAEDDLLNDTELNECIDALRSGVIPCQINQFFAKFARLPSDFDEIWHTCR